MVWIEMYILTCMAQMLLFCYFSMLSLHNRFRFHIPLSNKQIYRWRLQSRRSNQTGVVCWFQYWFVLWNSLNKKIACLSLELLFLGSIITQSDTCASGWSVNSFFRHGEQNFSWWFSGILFRAVKSINAVILLQISLLHYTQ